MRPIAIYNKCVITLSTYAIGRYSTENLIWHATWPTEWIFHSLLMAWADYLHTGNADLIRKHYADLKCKTLMALETEKGLVSTLTGLQSKEFLESIHFNGEKLLEIVDWPSGWQGKKPDGEMDGYEFMTYNTVVNAFYYHSLVLMSWIAATLNHWSDSEYFRMKAQKVYRLFNSSFFDSRNGIYIDGVGSLHSSIQSNVFPLVFGLVPEKNKKGVVEFIKSRGMACGVYPANFLLEALFDSGEEQYALDLLTSESDRSWMNMIRSGSTMTTEAWDLKYMPELMGWSHAWSASPAHIIPRKIMGIEPGEPGFGKINIKPHPGNLEYASVKILTIRGEILCSFRQEQKNYFELEITIPANTTAAVHLPKIAGEHKLSIDGKGDTLSRVESTRIVIENEGSGHHIFILR